VDAADMPQGVELTTLVPRQSRASVTAESAANGREAVAVLAVR
jgi:hypothetical protein